MNPLRATYFPNSKRFSVPELHNRTIRPSTLLTYANGRPIETSTEGAELLRTWPFKPCKLTAEMTSKWEVRTERKRPAPRPKREKPTGPVCYYCKKEVSLRRRLMLDTKGFCQPDCVISYYQRLYAKRDAREERRGSLSL